LIVGLLLALLYPLLVCVMFSFTGRSPVITQDTVRTIIDITGVLIGFGGIVLGVVPLHIRGAIREIASAIRRLSEPLTKAQQGIRLIESARSISPQFPDTMEKALTSYIDRLTSEVEKLKGLLSTYEMMRMRVVGSSLMMFIFFVLTLVIGFVHLGYSELINPDPALSLFAITIELLLLSLGIGCLLIMMAAFAA